jgi:hypothetical protein
MTLSNDDLPQVVEGLRQFSSSLSQSIKPFRWVGYSLLFLAVLDGLSLLIPLQLMNPAWALQTIGALVERAPVLLLALLLVFYGKAAFRANWERSLVKGLSWLCLLLGIFFFVLIPPGVLNTLRINTQSSSQISIQYNQQLDQAKQLEEQLNQANPDEIASFIESQGGSIEDKDPQDLKNELLAQLNQAKQTFELQYTETQTNQHLTLVKSAVKWNLGALMSGVLLIYLWRENRWARQSVKRPNL